MYDVSSSFPIFIHVSWIIPSTKGLYSGLQVLTCHVKSQITSLSSTKNRMWNMGPADNKSDGRPTCFPEVLWSNGGIDIRNPENLPIFNPMSKIWESCLRACVCGYAYYRYFLPVLSTSVTNVIWYWFLKR